MAIGSFEFFSDCLRRNVSFRIVLPNEGNVCGEAAPMKLLVLLHGYCGCSGGGGGGPPRGGRGRPQVGGAGPEISSMHCAAVRREQLLSGREGYGQKVWDLCRTRADPLCEEDFRAFR